MQHSSARSASQSRRDFLLQLGAAGLATALAPTLARAGASRKPNFIIIFTDDQGYQDLGCFGSPNIRTPNIDRMAKEGMKLTDFYVASSICTPSRAALLTGCYPKRISMAQGVLFPDAKRGLHPEEVTIADALKTQGYATACIGKWHLGDAEPFLPTKQGFDTYFGIPYSNDMNRGSKGQVGVPLMRDEKVIERPTKQETLTRRYTEEAVSYLKKNKDKPFFLYLAHTFPHVPLYASEQFKGKSKRGLYGDVIEEIDWSVGQIMATLREQGLERDTFVLFTSDNGPWLSRGEHGGSADPLRGGKMTTWEGGMRVPTIAWQPGTVPAGSTCAQPAGTIDLLPTIAAWAGAKLPADRTIDGKSIAPLFEGKSGAKSPHEAILFYSTRGQLEAIRSGDWKLHLAGQPSKRRGKTPAKTQAELYRLATDISESKNVASEHPQVVARLKKLAEQMDAQITKGRRPAGTISEAKAGKSS